ncbi:MAG: AAA family ATPase, partial [Paracoccaceae bacterium]
MQFTRLRLEGFKSFVDPTELAIEPGLTGVVGPNGCGKSNLLEALRWVMGESRARAMRGEGMEDVIFAGSDARPPRARASVELTIAPGDPPPAGFENAASIHIARRIQRDTGSDYRLDGKPTRARDVAVLLADAATGAGSPALVRQGRINEIIDARPRERRRLLEDAAGITGLHQRRHESLSKLKLAAENLERLDDDLARMAREQAALEAQCGAAKEYRRLAAELRRAEATLVAARWRVAEAALDSARRAHREARAARARRASEAKAAEAAREAVEAA